MTRDDGANAETVASNDNGLRVFDVSDLRQRCLGNMQLVERVLGQLEVAVDDECRKVEAAIIESDHGVVATAAHRLKGMAANVAAARLQDAAGAIESLARENASPSAIGAGYQELCEECSRLIDAVKQHFSERSAEGSGS